MKKRLIAISLALIAVLLLSVTAVAAIPLIKETEYKGNGVVEVEFTRDVWYDDVKVTLTDEAGGAVSATVVELDDDELTFRAEDLQSDAQYTCTISGIRTGRTGTEQTVTASFRVPSRYPESQGQRRYFDDDDFDDYYDDDFYEDAFDFDDRFDDDFRYVRSVWGDRD